MKILHTADWHIGKVLHKHSLKEEQILFLQWLTQLIKEASVDILLISGDVFDQSNPSVKDRQLYYQFLKELIGTQTKIIITGGNHDSIGVLNGPKEILQILDVHIVGGATEKLEDELIEIKDADGVVQLVVAAVPYLRDKDLRRLQTEAQYKDRTEAIREGIKHHYAAVADLCVEQYPDIPVIAMGHLYARGVEISDSEREIQVGNAAAITSDIFSDVFQYVALGHIHKPQIINKNPFIRYSGSPVALSFSEKKDEKIVLMLEYSDGLIGQPQVYKVPKFRNLNRLSGTFQEIQEKISDFEQQAALPAFLELEITEPKRDIQLISEVDEYVFQQSDNPLFKILKHRFVFEQNELNTKDLFVEGTYIEDLKLEDVFVKRMQAQHQSETEVEEMLDVFKELLDDFYQKETP